MLKRNDIIFFGISLMLGGLLQIYTSSVWLSYQDIKIGAEYNLGELIFMLGQTVGQLIWLIGARKVLKDFLLFSATADFFISLSIVDVLFISCLNPFEISLPKYLSFVVGAIVVLIRVINYYR